MSRAAITSAVCGKLTPSQTFCLKYSVADLGSRCSGLKRSSPIAPLSRMLASMPSHCASIGGSHAQPCSVMTNFSRGNRSKTPDSSMKNSGRRE